METDENDFINMPLRKQDIYFNRFLYNKKYHIIILDLLKGRKVKRNETCIYLVFNVRYLEDYTELDMVKGEMAYTYFALNSFMPKLDYVLRKDGKQRSQFLNHLRYDLNIEFIRHNKNRFEILNYSFDPLYNKI